MELNRLLKTYYQSDQALEKTIYNEFTHYCLDNILGIEATLSLNEELSTIALMTTAHNGRPTMIGEVQATPVEFNMFFQILESFPHACTYDILHAAYNNREVNAEKVKLAREFLMNAEENKIWDGEVRPLRGAISRLRIKNRKMGIEIAAVLKTGYTIMKYQKYMYLSQ